MHFHVHSFQYIFIDISTFSSDSFEYVCFQSSIDLEYIPDTRLIDRYINDTRSFFIKQRRIFFKYTVQSEIYTYCVTWLNWSMPAPWTKLNYSLGAGQYSNDDFCLVSQIVNWRWCVSRSALQLYYIHFTYLYVISDGMPRICASLVQANMQTH